MHFRKIPPPIVPSYDPDGPGSNPVFKITVLAETGKMAFETPGS